MATSMQTYEVDIADVEYLSHGTTPLLARVFKPEGSGPFPIMVELHGGAWVRGDRLNGNAANEALAKNGVIVVALDFRVPPGPPRPWPLPSPSTGHAWGPLARPSLRAECNHLSALWHSDNVPTDR